MKKGILTFLSFLLVISSFAQSWQKTGNELQFRIVGPDTNFRFSRGTGYTYLYTKPQINVIAAGKLNVGLALLKTDTAAMLGNVVHKALTETITGNKTLTGKSIFAKATFQDTVLFNALANAVANTDNRILTYSPGHGNMAGYVVLSTMALDAAVFHKTGNETAAGNKTFSGVTLFQGNVTGNTFLSIPNVITNTLNVDVVRANLPLGAILTVTIINGGSGYVNGVYNNVPLTGGTGTGATGNITVSGGVVTGVTVGVTGTRGSGFLIEDILSASNTNLGGTGSGLQIRVASIFNSVRFLGDANILSAQFNRTTGDWFFYTNLNATTGVIMTSPDGTRYRVNIANGGSSFIITAP